MNYALNWLIWCALYMIVSFALETAKPGSFGKGKLTTLLRRYGRPHFLFRSDMILLTRLGLGAVLSIGANMLGAGILLGHALYFGSAIVFLLDDWFSDDDHFKRFFEGVRNKVKWKMDLPPVPEPRAGTN